MKFFHFTRPLFIIRLGFHKTWYLAFALIIAVMVTRFPDYYPFTERLLFGLVAGVLFFLAMTLRQLAINITSHFRHIPIKEVKLYPFGGVTLVAKEESLPVLEALLAVVGLLTSLIVVVIFYLVYVVLVVAGSVWFAWLIQWLAYLNLILFIVHFIPGFPLDGGRILRAILWKTTGNYDRATLITLRIGQAASAVFYIGGLLLVLNRQWFAGVMVVFLGWILYMAAANISQNISLTRSLAGMSVQHIMSQEYSIIPPHLTLDNLFKDFVMTSGHRQFVVYDEDKLHGVLILDEMKPVPRRKWESMPVSQVMKPSTRQTTAYFDQSAADLLDRMNAYRLSAIPVMESNRVVGLAVREVMIRFYKTRAKLKF